MITPADIKTYRHKDLVQLAKQRGIVGWHAMKKADLLAAILKSQGRASGGKGSASPARSPATIPRKPSQTVLQRNPPSATKVTEKKRPPTAAQRRIRVAQANREQLRDLSTRRSGDTEDQILLMVRDPYWLQATWEITARSIERAQAALAEHWHDARPVLRLLEIADISASSHSESVAKVIPIHGAVRCWYLEAPNPPANFRVEIGYLTRQGRFHGLARSNHVTTPQPGSTELMEGVLMDVAENSERIFAMSGGYDPDMNHEELRRWLESRLHRPLGGPTVGRYGQSGGMAGGKMDRLPLSVDAEMIIFGSTHPDSHLTISSEPVRIQPDGSFSARVGLPDRRQIVPIVAVSQDGIEERTVVLAVERNTKVMEVRRREPGEPAT